MFILILLGNSNAEIAASRQKEAYEKAGHEVVVYNFPHRSLNLDVYTPYTIRDKIISLLPDNRPIILEGHSLGGHIAIEIAHFLRGTGRILGMILIGTPPCGPTTFHKAFLPPKDDPDLLNLLGSDQVFTLDQAQRFAYPAFGWDKADDQLDDESQCLKEATIGRLMINKKIAKVRASIYANIPETGDQAAKISSLDMPICVIQGSNDLVVSLEYLNEVQWPALFQDRVHVIENAPHYANWTHHKIFNNVALRYIKMISDIGETAMNNFNNEFKPLTDPKITKLINLHERGKISDSIFSKIIRSFKDQMGSYTPMDTIHKNNLKNLKYVMTFARKHKFVNDILTMRGPYYNAPLLHIGINGHAKDTVRWLSTEFPRLKSMTNSYGTTAKSYARTEGLSDILDVL